MSFHIRELKRDLRWRETRVTERGKIIEILTKTASREGGKARKEGVEESVCVWLWFIFPAGSRPPPYHNPESGGRGGTEGVRPQTHN